MLALATAKAQCSQCSSSVQMMRLLLLSFSNSNRFSSNYSAYEGSRRMKKLLYKGSKTKKTWYKHHLGNPMETPEAIKTKKGSISPAHKIRLEQHSHILYDKITEIINTGELSQEIQDMQVSITSIKLTKDMDTLKVYWDADRKDWEVLEKLLFQHSKKLRGLLISYHVLGRIPLITFVKAKSKVNLVELTEIFEKLDYGPGYMPGQNQADNVEDTDNSNNVKESDPGNIQASSKLTSPEVSPEIEKETLEFLSSLKISVKEENIEMVSSDNKSVDNDSALQFEKRLNFRSDMYGLDRDSIMKKILAKKKINSETTVPQQDLISKKDFGHAQILQSSFLGKTIEMEKQLKWERKMKKSLLERDDSFDEYS